MVYCIGEKVFSERWRYNEKGYEYIPGTKVVYCRVKGYSLSDGVIKGKGYSLSYGGR